jgi:thiaminase/transcriptional activator TenA
MRSQPFSLTLWSRIERIYGAILRHPFIRGLTDGTLKPANFRFYVIQDAHYLREYARALAVAAARAPAEEEIAMFASHAAAAIEVERSLHEGFFRDFGLSAEEVGAAEMAPTNLAYTSYLLACAYGGSFAEALGALLPCYWIYWRVGEQLLERGSPEPLYRRWIETYGGEEFASIVRPVIALTDQLGATLGQVERERSSGRFVTTSRYEWMFWEMAWRRERWPLSEL